ncbi:MAG: hypothetical protein DMF99_29550 [Acidobacteria bacterium]|nr:MAG: hypothetical protein DMF99_29550 [Acidobacteriota bacterium]
MQNLRWKVITIISVFIVFSAVGVYPILAARKGINSPSWLMDKQLKLGLDLKGGVHLDLRVDAVPRRGRAAGAGRGVPNGRERSAGELRSRLRDERQLHLHDEAERAGESPRRGGRAGAADDRAPRQ